MEMNGLSRRDFLALTGSAAALAAFGKQAYADGDPIILGSGSHRYAWVPDWLTPPSDILYGDTHGIVQDAKGNIYVSHTVHPDSPKKDAICVFDRHGKFLTSWGSQFVGGGHGLSIRHEGHEQFLYHCDVNHNRFSKTKLDGTVIWDKGTPEEPGVYPGGKGFKPTNIAFAPNGDFYVADGYGSSYVHQYNLDGKWIKTWGGRGREAGKLDCPHGIWYDDRNRHDPLLAVADRSNHRIQYFTLDGEHVKFVTDGMRQPCHFQLRGDMMLVPDLDSIVTLLDKDNKVIVQVGDGDVNNQPSPLRDHPRSDFIPGKFVHPHSACFVNGDDICVVEWVPIGRVTLLKKVRDNRY
jgi:hypothetical protein